MVAIQQWQSCRICQNVSSGAGQGAGIGGREMNYPEFNLEKALAGEPAALKMHGCIAKTVIKNQCCLLANIL